MKKFLSLLLAATAMSLQAQTLMVNDFESGDGGAYVAWGGECEVIDNPVKGDANSSDKILKITTEEMAPVGFPVVLPEGKTLLDYTGLRFQAIILEEVAGSSIHWIGINIGISEDRESMVNLNVQDPGAAWGDGQLLKWMDIELVFNEETLAATLEESESDQLNVMIQLGRNEFIYGVDNLRLVEKEVLANPNIRFTFENDDPGISPRYNAPWSGACEVVENTYKSAINSSQRALKITNPEFSPITYANTLPDGKKWSDYESIRFQICVLSGEDVEWAGIEVGVRNENDNGQHTKIGAAYDENGQETAAYGECVIGEWLNVELSINETLVTSTIEEVALMYIRLMKSNMEYLIDNVELVPVGGGGNSIERRGVSEMNVYGGKGQILVELEKAVQINVFTIEGKIVKSEVMKEGQHALSLPAGLYIVNNNKVVVY